MGGPFADTLLTEFKTEFRGQSSRSWNRVELESRATSAWKEPAQRGRCLARPEGQVVEPLRPAWYRW